MSSFPALFLFLPLVLLTWTVRAAPPELTQLQQQYQQSVTAPHETAKGALDAKFVTALGNAAQMAKQEGNLDELLAIQQDQKRLTDKLPIPDDDEQTPEPLKKLRAIYRDQLAKLEAQRAASHAALLPAYTTKLRQLEATLTKADRIAEALEVKTHREGMAQGGQVEAPAAASTAAPMTAKAPANGEQPPSVPAAASVPKIKGDDRKAAEWVLSVGGNVTLFAGGRELVVNDAASLPPGKFEVLKVFLKFFEGKQPAAPITDLLALAGLQGLKELNTAGVKSLADEHLAVLRSLPSLRVAYFNAGNLTDAAFAHLAAAPMLAIIHFGDQPRITGTGLASLAKRDTLVHLNIQGCRGLSDEGFAELAQLRQLQVLFVDSTPFKDVHLPVLDGMKQLRDLEVKGCAVTSGGLASRKALAGLKTLAMSLTSGEGGSTAANLGKACPALGNLIITGRSSGAPLVAEDTAPLGALPKLRELKLYSPGISAAAVAGISGMPGLQVLRFGYLKFTDECLPPMLSHKGLQEIDFGEALISDAGLLGLAQMKSLKQIKIKGCPQLTPAGMDAFKKKRPDVKVE